MSRRVHDVHSCGEEEVAFKAMRARRSGSLREH